VYSSKPGGKSATKSAIWTLGITGGVCSGKSAVCGFLTQKGMPVHSADELARQAVKPGTYAYDRIADRFGPGILCADASLDRPQLRRMIIRERSVKDFLEGLIHPEVIRLMRICFEDARKNGDAVCGVEVPLLFESGFSAFFDYILTVTVSPETRIRRLMKRDGVSRSEAEALAGIQMPDHEKIRKSDFIIENNGDMDELEMSVDRFCHKLMERLENYDKKA